MNMPPILSIIKSVTTDAMLNFNRPLNNGLKNATCKQGFTPVVLMYFPSNLENPI